MTVSSLPALTATTPSRFSDARRGSSSANCVDTNGPRGQSSSTRTVDSCWHRALSTKRFGFGMSTPAAASRCNPFRTWSRASLSTRVGRSLLLPLASAFLYGTGKLTVNAFDTPARGMASASRAAAAAVTPTTSRARWARRWRVCSPSRARSRAAALRWRCSSRASSRSVASPSRGRRQAKCSLWPRPTPRRRPCSRRISTPNRTPRRPSPSSCGCGASPLTCLRSCQARAPSATRSCGSLARSCTPTQGLTSRRAVDTSLCASSTLRAATSCAPTRYRRALSALRCRRWRCRIVRTSHPSSSLH
mmetsp:Transcript_57466/g.131963  ORF Transcript_57466/g.131963 Transcript_57466/m.131963 type:complete len:305 (+) Transcript_57466:332-1246(+)